jgi:very-short-patch-repair endonuclease
VDGPIHAYNPEQDALRQEYLQGLGMKVLRFSDDQIEHHLSQALNSIMEAIKLV